MWTAIKHASKSNVTEPLSLAFKLMTARVIIPKKVQITFNIKIFNSCQANLLKIKGDLEGCFCWRRR